MSCGEHEAWWSKKRNLTEREEWNRHDAPDRPIVVLWVKSEYGWDEDLDEEDSDNVSENVIECLSLVDALSCAKILKASSCQCRSDT